MQVHGPRALRPLLVAMLVAFSAGCGPSREGDPEALCTAVDDIADTARALGSGNALGLDEVAAHYRQLADAYRQVAGELQIPSA